MPRLGKRRFKQLWKSWTQRNGNEANVVKLQAKWPSDLFFLISTLSITPNNVENWWGNRECFSKTLSESDPRHSLHIGVTFCDTQEDVNRSRRASLTFCSRRARELRCWEWDNGTWKALPSAGWLQVIAWPPAILIYFGFALWMESQAFARMDLQAKTGPSPWLNPVRSI